MQLSVRLAALAKFVPKGSKVIDVGTDHAYMPIYLRQTERAISCLATDINKGPLEKAAHNLKKYQISGVRLKQTNGLEGLEEEDANVIMISGMGGFLMIDILKRQPELVKRMHYLILQPQQDVMPLRKYLHSIGFKIETEDFVKDGEKYYNIVVACKGEEYYDKAYEYAYGKQLILNHNPVFEEWLDYKLNKQQGILEQLKTQNSDTVTRRRQELCEEITALQEVKKCLDLKK